MAKSAVVFLSLLWLFHPMLTAAETNVNLNTTALFGTSPRRDLRFPELAVYDGYSPEIHYVTTTDGYILTLFRVMPKGNETSDSKKLPFLFAHGLYLSADDCIIPGPNIAHCYNYADRGYDTWVPNMRGNKYSRAHTNLDPDTDSDFWDFSIDEMAQYDMPAIVDYVLNFTGKPQVNFVGHSQGVTIALLMCAKQPQYNDKFAMVFGLSTTAWLDYARFIVVSLQGLLSPLLSTAVNLGLNMEVLAHGSIAQETAEYLCGLTNLSYPFCSLFLFAVLGYNHNEISNKTLPAFVGHQPSGTSLKNFNRWGQIRANGFTEYDYGPIKNLAIYGQLTPKEYDLSNVTVPMKFIASLNDYVSAVEDVAKLATKLPNTTTCVLSDKLFGHLDFLYGDDIPNYLSPIIFSYIENGTHVCT